jgi:hypothetical protein
MSLFQDLLGTTETEFSIGRGKLLWLPTADRDIVLPDASGTVLLLDANGRANGITPAIAPGQALTFEQIAGNSLYGGALDVRIVPGSSSALSFLACSPTVSGTITQGALADTNSLTRVRRQILTTAAGAGSLAYFRQPNLFVHRGSASGRGGFRFVQQLGLATLVAGNRGFFGLNDQTSNPTNVDPLTSTVANKIGIAFASETGNLSLINGVAGVAPTVLNLGASFPVNIAHLIEFVFASLPNQSGIDYVIRNKENGAIASGTLTTNIPANTVYLAPTSWMCNNATAAACGFAHTGLILTSPF